MIIYLGGNLYAKARWGYGGPEAHSSIDGIDRASKTAEETISRIFHADSNLVRFQPGTDVKKGTKRKSLKNIQIIPNANPSHEKVRS